MKTYTGERTFDAIVVTVNGDALSPRHDLKRYVDTHFEWGYEGDASRQLSLAILADCAGDEVALRHAEAFMRTIVANFSNEWEMTETDVRQAIAALEDMP